MGEEPSENRVEGRNSQFEDGFGRNAFLEFVNWHFVFGVGGLVVCLEAHVFD